uniref:Major vault protein n=1 Tax=Callorhinchus milii TaxID=7868 RepID=V9KUC1_CALMI
MTEETIIRIPPYHYIHVLEQNSNVARIESGPQTYIRQDNERVLFPPLAMVTVPPRCYCVIENPVLRDAEAAAVLDVWGQAKLQHGDREVRLTQDPFPLYPGETLLQGVTQLQVVRVNTALHLQCHRDFQDESGDQRKAGDEWLFEGPGTYIPRKEVDVFQTIQATVIRNNQAIRLRARKTTRDREGRERVTGEEWLVRRGGAYLPGVYEEVIDVVNAFILTEKLALHVRARQMFKDEGGRTRRTGEEWLITLSQTDAHIPDVNEEVLGEIGITTLTSRQYCTVLDPVNTDTDRKNQLGKKRVVKGERSFFLQPGERLESGIQEVFVLSEREGLVLRATEGFTDTDQDGEEVERRAGDLWMIRGAREYVPREEVEVVVRREAIPLDENEGIYVRDIRTGKVRAVLGQTYLLAEDEEMWEKVLPSNVESLLLAARDPVSDRGERERGGEKVGERRSDCAREGGERARCSDCERERVM